MSDDLHDEYYVRIYRKRETDSDEYRDFLRFVFSRYVEPRLRGSSAQQALEEWKELRQRLYATAQLIREHEQMVANGQSVPLDLDLADIQPSLLNAIRVNNQLLVDTEIVDIIEEYFDALVDGLSVNDLPPEDFEALRQSGSADPRGELATDVRVIKARKQQIITSDQSSSFSSRLKSLPETIQRLLHRPSQATGRRGANIDRDSNSKTRTRRVYTGMGHITNGTVLSIVNLGIAISAGIAGHPIDMAGVMTSAGTGVSLLLLGKGDLDGE